MTPSWVFSGMLGVGLTQSMVGIGLGVIIGLGLVIVSFWLLLKTNLDTPATRADQVKAAEQLRNYYSGRPKDPTVTQAEADDKKSRRLASGYRISRAVWAISVSLLTIAFALGALLSSGDGLRRIVIGSVAMVLTSIALWIVSLIAAVLVSAHRARRQGQGPTGS
jgi:hypothetical protein